MSDNSNGNGNRVWQWVAGFMASAVLFLAGSLIGAGSASAEHERLDGHPVTIERLNSLQKQRENDMFWLNQRLTRLEEKLDIAIELLKEND